VDGASLAGMSDAKPKTARSYRASVVGDNTVISLNIKWLNLNPLSWGKRKKK